jgi:hypothetical protein
VCSTYVATYPKYKVSLLCHLLWRPSRKRVDAQQCEAAKQNAIRHSTMQSDARQRKATLDIVKRNIAMSFSNIMLKRETFKKCRFALSCCFVPSSVTWRYRIVTSRCRIVTSRCPMITSRCQVSGWAEIQTIRRDNAIRRLTMRYDTLQHEVMFYKMSRSFSDFYTATMRQREVTMRSDNATTPSDARQYECEATIFCIVAVSLHIVLRRPFNTTDDIINGTIKKPYKYARRAGV